VWVDGQERLHLKITERDGKWYCAEVFTEKSFGYAEYRFYLASRVDQLDENVVAGLFTYKSGTEEIDIEFSRWGNASNPNNGQYVVQPDLVCDFPVALNGDHSTHWFIWDPDRVTFQSIHGHYARPPSSGYEIKTCVYEGAHIPTPSDEKVHINLWLANGQPPTTDSEPAGLELIVERVEILGARARSFWLNVNLGGVSWQRFIARLVAFGPVNQWVPGSILQLAPTDYTLVGAVADDLEPA